MPTPKKPTLQTFIAFPIDKWDEMMSFIAEKFRKQTIFEIAAQPKSDIFTLFAAPAGKSDATHRMCTHHVTSSQYKFYLEGMPDWVLIDCFPLEQNISPREFLATHGMHLVGDISLDWLKKREMAPARVAG